MSLTDVDVQPPDEEPTAARRRGRFTSVLQFQFRRALAKASGCTAPLHRCLIYGTTEAGERMKKALRWARRARGRMSSRR